LLEQGYEVDGLDSNKKFLAKIKKQLKTREISTKASFAPGSVIEYHGPDPEKQYDSVIYTWHTILEAFGPGNLLKSLNSAWRKLKPGGLLVFDQPTRKNKGLEDGWYGHEPEVEGDISYLSYIMTEEEIRFILKISGFQSVKITKWTSKPTEEYPEGMKKITVSAKKPKGKRYKDYVPRFDFDE
jgi:SAM-dependent methyltransferase